MVAKYTIKERMEKFMKATKLEKLDLMKSLNLGSKTRFLNPSCSNNARDFKEWNPPIVPENLVLLVADNFYIDDLFALLQSLFYPRIISYESMVFFDFTFDQTKIDELKPNLNKTEIQKHLNLVNLSRFFNTTDSQEAHQIAKLHEALFFFWNLLYSPLLIFELDNKGVRFYARENIQAFSTECKTHFSFQALFEELQKYNFDFCSKLEFLLAFADFLYPQVLHKGKYHFLEFLYRDDLFIQYQTSPNITNMELAMNIFEIDFQDRQKCEDFCVFLSLVWNLSFKTRNLKIKTAVGIDEDEVIVAQISAGTKPNICSTTQKQGDRQ